MTKEDRDFYEEFHEDEQSILYEDEPEDEGEEYDG